MFYSHSTTQQAPQQFDLLQSLIHRLESGSRTAWGIGRRSTDGCYYIMHQRRCVPLVHLRFSIQNVQTGTRLTATEDTLNFQIILSQDTEAHKTHASFYRIEPQCQPLLDTDSGPLTGYIFAVGALGNQSEAVGYGLYAVFSGKSSCVLGDSSPELLESWNATVELWEGGSGGAK